MKYFLLSIVSLLSIASATLTNSLKVVKSTNTFALNEIDNRAVEIIDYTPTNNQIEEILNHSNGVIVLNKNDNIETQSFQKNTIHGS